MRRSPKCKPHPRMMMPRLLLRHLPGELRLLHHRERQVSDDVLPNTAITYSLGTNFLPIHCRDNYLLVLFATKCIVFAALPFREVWDQPTMNLAPQSWKRFENLKNGSASWKNGKMKIRKPISDFRKCCSAKEPAGSPSHVPIAKHPLPKMVDASICFVHAVANALLGKELPLVSNV